MWCAACLQVHEPAAPTAPTAKWSEEKQDQTGGHDDHSPNEGDGHDLVLRVIAVSRRQQLLQSNVHLRSMAKQRYPREERRHETPINRRQHPRSRHRGKQKNKCMRTLDVSTPSINTTQTRHYRRPHARPPTSIPPRTYHHAGNEAKQDSIHQLVEHLAQHHPAQGSPKQLGHARQGGPEERLRLGPRRVVDWHGNGNALGNAAEQTRRYRQRERGRAQGEAHATS